MRYLIDTHIFVYLSTDAPLLDRNVMSLFDDYENSFYISTESIKELIVLFRKKKITTKSWKNEKAMIESLEKDFGIHILPLKKEHLLTYAALTTSDDHNDPSDHVIISQAITEKMPLISSDLKFPFYKRQKLDFIYNKK